MDSYSMREQVMYLVNTQREYEIIPGMVNTESVTDFDYWMDMEDILKAHLDEELKSLFLPVKNPDRSVAFESPRANDNELIPKKVTQTGKSKRTCNHFDDEVSAPVAKHHTPSPEQDPFSQWIDLGQFSEEALPEMDSTALSNGLEPCMDVKDWEEWLESELEQKKEKKRKRNDVDDEVSAPVAKCHTPSPVFETPNPASAGPATASAGPATAPASAGPAPAPVSAGADPFYKFLWTVRNIELSEFENFPAWYREDYIDSFEQDQFSQWTDLGQSSSDEEDEEEEEAQQEMDLTALSNGLEPCMEVENWEELLSAELQGMTRKGKKKRKRNDIDDKVSAPVSKCHTPSPAFETSAPASAGPPAPVSVDPAPRPEDIIPVSVLFTSFSLYIHEQWEQVKRIFHTCNRKFIYMLLEEQWKLLNRDVKARFHAKAEEAKIIFSERTSHQSTTS